MNNNNQLSSGMLCRCIALALLQTLLALECAWGYDLNCSLRETTDTLSPSLIIGQAFWQNRFLQMNYQQVPLPEGITHNNRNNTIRFVYADTTQITVYTPGFEEFSRHFGADAIPALFVGDNAKSFLEKTSLSRKDAYLRGVNAASAVKETLINGFRARTSLSSFRRHILYAPNNGYAVDVKIPGDKRVKVSTRNFDFAVKLLNRCGPKLKNLIFEPVMKIKLPRGIYALYGEERKCAPTLIVYKHYDAKRLNHVTPEYIQEISRRTGTQEKTLYERIATTPPKILRLFHDAGIRVTAFGFRTDMHLNNYALTRNGDVKFVSDFGAAWEEARIFSYRPMKNWGRRKELDILIEFPVSAFIIRKAKNEAKNIARCYLTLMKFKAQFFLIKQKMAWEMRWQMWKLKQEIIKKSFQGIPERGLPLRRSPADESILDMIAGKAPVMPIENSIAPIAETPSEKPTDDSNAQPEMSESDQLKLETS